jgi:hypothetical protein
MSKNQVAVVYSAFKLRFSVISGLDEVDAAQSPHRPIDINVSTEKSGFLCAGFTCVVINFLLPSQTF